jgi:hypothetical protein
MEKIEKSLFVIIIVLVIAICMLSIKGCEDDAANEKLTEQLSNYEISNKEFKTKRLLDSSTIVQQTQTILTQSEATKLGLIKLEGEIVKLQSQVAISQQLKYRKIDVPFVPENFADTTSWQFKFKNGDSSKSIIDSLLNNSIIVPKNFTIKDKWLEIGGIVKKQGVTIDSIVIPNKTSVSIGWKRQGFLGVMKVPVVEVKNSNPNLSVVDMNNVVIKDKKGLSQKPLFWLGIGLLGGLLIK